MSTPTAAPPFDRREGADELIARLLQRCTFPPPGHAVCCAVSGGADSSALLILAVAAGCVAEAVHVDHGLRRSSAAEADRVAALAGRVGAGFRAVAVRVAPGGNLEARARVARFAALPEGVLTGHTADDQAETMLVNLLRGAALDGLAAMLAGPTRPLLGLRRAETWGLCEALGVTAVEDLSNLDRRFLRNRVRHELLPFLAELSGRDPVPVLCRQAVHFRAAGDVLAALAADVDPTDARALISAPAAVAAEAVRGWLRPLSAERHPPDTATVARVLAVARGETRATEVGGGWRVSRTAGRLRHTMAPGRGEG